MRVGIRLHRVCFEVSCNLGESNLFFGHKKGYIKDGKATERQISGMERSSGTTRVRCQN
jgi:hypothetical protein